ncbi:hypothetical protein EHQ76_09135 [Leptospira barantonii]|uniref:Uncharacterized protein n=1 Tax=Leptospira barantonii TaxID=2023184 RepID=A0A5F2BDZ5_9LEPT|nr:hypothetical protein [Leptospira barantonii]TGM03795.1 hypothetical protein EHQ76_09135 [Leptospira barantonii]
MRYSIDIKDNKLVLKNKNENDYRLEYKNNINPIDLPYYITVLEDRNKTLITMDYGVRENKIRKYEIESNVIEAGEKSGRFYRVVIENAALIDALIEKVRESIIHNKQGIDKRKEANIENNEEIVKAMISPGSATIHGA